MKTCFSCDNIIKKDRPAHTKYCKECRANRDREARKRSSRKRYNNPAIKKVIREKAKKRYHQPSIRNKMLAYMKEYRNRPLIKAKQKAYLKEYYQTYRKPSPAMYEAARIKIMTELKD